ncbi:MAG TPA: nucleotidyltransferase family protein [bacterium]|nr:nucleotidyltransferase family protein [bacterium]
MSAQLLHIPDLTPRKPFLEAAGDPYIRMMQALRAVEGDPARLPEPLSLRYQHNLAANLMKEKVFFSVVKRLNDHGITDIAPLKGILWLQTLYRDISGVRTMCDVDILLRKKDYSPSRRILAPIARVHGSQSRRPILNALFHEYSAVIGDTLVEIHRGQHPMDLFSVDYDDLFLHAVPCEERGLRYRKISPEHALIFSLIHDLSAGFAYPFVSWRHLAEMRLLLAHVSLTAVRDLAVRYDMEELLDLYLFLLYTLFEEPGLTTDQFRIRPWFAGIIKGRDPQPFRFDKGDRLFKLILFRRTLSRFLLPRIIALPDHLVKPFLK